MDRNKRKNIQKDNISNQDVNTERMRKKGIEFVDLSHINTLLLLQSSKIIELFMK
jgi:hypothetical protein